MKKLLGLALVFTVSCGTDGKDGKSTTIIPVIPETPGTPVVETPETVPPVTASELPPGVAVALGDGAGFYNTTTGRWYGPCQSKDNVSTRLMFDIGAAGWAAGTMTFPAKDCIGSGAVTANSMETYRTLATDSFSGWYRLIGVCVDVCPKQTTLTYVQMIGDTLFKMDVLNGAKAEYKRQ